MLDDHILNMRTAIKLAKYALDHGETPVACIFVHAPTNRIIAFGMNDTNKSLSGISHAEFIGIKKIQNILGDQNTTIFKDIILYVTVEPCIMCASALKQLGIGKVFFGCSNERFGGNGSILKINQDLCTAPENNYASIPGLLRRESIMLLRLFYVKENERSPKPKVKLNRKLDKKNFPKINWAMYVDETEFTENFGEENLKYYQKDEDISPHLDWDLIENEYNNVVKVLETETNEFNLIDNKRLKISK